MPARNGGRLAVVTGASAGIGEATAPLCTRAGATVLVAGSAVFCAKDPAAAMAAIRSACE